MFKSRWISASIAVILVVTGALLVAGIMAWQYRWLSESKTSRSQERKVIVPSSEEDCLSIEEPFYRNNCYIDLAKTTKDESLCKKIESTPLGSESDKNSAIANCYVQLAVIKNDPALCDKAESIELRDEFSNWCKEYFNNPSEFQVRGKEYGFEVSLPKAWKCDELTISHGGYFYQNGINCVKITDVDDIHFTILQSEPPYYFENQEVTFKEYIAKEKQKIQQEWGSVKEEQIALDTLPAIKLTFQREGVTHYLTEYQTDCYKVLVQKEESLYVIEVMIDFSKLDIYNAVFNQILSTFRFLD